MAAMSARRGFVALWLLLGSLCASSSGAEDDFLDAYRQGRDAIESQQWELAAEKMREAVAGRSEASRSLVKKGYVKRYVPHYFLGVALFELGDCQGALDSWKESERQGVATRRKVFRENLESSRDQCQAQSTTTARAPSSEPQKVEEPAPRVSEERSVVRDEPKRPARKVEPSRAPSTEREESARIRGDNPPPAELNSAVGAYLDGDYSQVVEVLEGFSSEEPGILAQAHLLRSAALFALSRIRDDAELGIWARAEASAALAAEPGLTLSERFFSPGFRALFQAIKDSVPED